MKNLKLREAVLENYRYLVVGAGISGIAACKLLKSKGKIFSLYDGNAKLDSKALREKYTVLADAAIYTGDFPEDLYDKIDICVLSPGVPTDLPFVETLRSHGVVISGEIELAYEMGKGRVVAITGTNGKTTTTSLVGEIMAMAFADSRVVGNIGIPYTSIAADTTDETMVVAEISSFQLETIADFKPYVSAILNITPDHLDRHHSMENYIHAKEAITKNQGLTDYCVLNYDDSVLRKFGQTLSCEVIWFSSKNEPDIGVFYKDGALWEKNDRETVKVIDTDELQIIGIHNFENAAAAVAICHACGISLDVIRKGLREFRAVAHRIEFICEKRGVRFYNDSKGTNPDAAIKAVEAMNWPTLLIGGGYDKNASYDEWIESFGNTVKKLVLIGTTKEKIASCAKQHGFKAVEMAETLEEAMDICYRESQPGDAILLSPACASWDMFPNYEERGRVFAEYARGLAE